MECTTRAPSTEFKQVASKACRSSLLDMKWATALKPNFARGKSDGTASTYFVALRMMRRLSGMCKAVV
eukprot:7277445-Lingulodinium_polyedra.AAC.1